MQALRRGILAIACTVLIVGCTLTGNNFDGTKLSQIKKGETNEADLVKLFGQSQSQLINAEGVTMRLAGPWIIW